MKKAGFLYAGILLLSVSFSLNASAEYFWATGKIKRTLVDISFAGCMVYLDKDIGHSCPSRWISLDCKGLFNDKNKERGQRMFSSAMAAAHADKTVSLLVDSLKKANTYCVARRIYVVF